MFIQSVGAQDEILVRALGVEQRTHVIRQSWEGLASDRVDTMRCADTSLAPASFSIFGM